MSWCPIDSTYLLTCAKDNRTICWDTVSGEVSFCCAYISLRRIVTFPFHGDFFPVLVFGFLLISFFTHDSFNMNCLQIVAELPAGTNWNFDVHWYSKIPGIISASSFDGKVGIYNIEVSLCLMVLFQWLLVFSVINDGVGTRDIIGTTLLSMQHLTNRVALENLYTKYWAVGVHLHAEDGYISRALTVTLECTQLNSSIMITTSQRKPKIVFVLSCLGPANQLSHKFLIWFSTE